MPTFTWEAVTREGQRRSGEIETATRGEALAFLHREHLLPISISLKKPKRRFSFSLPLVGGGVSQIDVITFSRHLAVMIKAGLGIVQIFDILIADAEKAKMRAFFEKTRTELERGQSLWSSLEHEKEMFPPYAVGLVRAGEAAGNLDKSLEEISRSMLRDYESRRRVMSAMMYPAILLGAAFFLLLFLFFFALPKLAESFLQAGVELPFLTRLLFEVGTFVGSRPALVVAIVAGIFGGSGFLVFSRPGRNLLGRVAWQVGPLRALIKKFTLSRFARTLASLLSSGVPAMESLSITASSIRFPLFQGKILSARENVRKGTTLSDAFRQYPDLYPQLLTSMMAVGERSGQLSELLGTVAQFYEEEAERQLTTLIGLVEPMLLLGMGGLVGFIAISVLLPIYQFVTSV